MAETFPASYWTWSSSASICPFFGRLSALAIRLLRASGPLTAPPAAPSLLAFFSRKPGLTPGGACAAAAGATGAAAAAVSGSGPAPPAAADDGGAADELAAGGTVDAGRFEFCVAARASPASVSQHTGQIKTRTGMREAWHRASTVARVPGRSRDAPWRALRNLGQQAPGRSSASRFSSAPTLFRQQGKGQGAQCMGKAGCVKHRGSIVIGLGLARRTCHELGHVIPVVIIRHGRCAAFESSRPARHAD